MLCVVMPYYRISTPSKASVRSQDVLSVKQAKRTSSAMVCSIRGFKWFESGLSCGSESDSVKDGITLAFSREE